MQQPNGQSQPGTVVNLELIHFDGSHDLSKSRDRLEDNSGLVIVTAMHQPYQLQVCKGMGNIMFSTHYCITLSPICLLSFALGLRIALMLDYLGFFLVSKAVPFSLHSWK